MPIGIQGEQDRQNASAKPVRSTFSALLFHLPLYVADDDTSRQNDGPRLEFFEKFLDRVAPF